VDPELVLHGADADPAALADELHAFLKF
jgi:hypothetical protein